MQATNLENLDSGIIPCVNYISIALLLLFLSIVDLIFLVIFNETINEFILFEIFFKSNRFW